MNLLKLLKNNAIIFENKLKRDLLSEQSRKPGVGTYYSLMHKEKIKELTSKDKDTNNYKGFNKIEFTTPTSAHSMKVVLMSVDNKIKDITPNNVTNITGISDISGYIKNVANIVNKIEAFKPYISSINKILNIVAILIRKYQTAINKKDNNTAKTVRRALSKIEISVDKRGLDKNIFRYLTQYLKEINSKKAVNLLTKVLND